MAFFRWERAVRLYHLLAVFMVFSGCGTKRLASLTARADSVTTTGDSALMLRGGINVMVPYTPGAEFESATVVPTPTGIFQAGTVYSITSVNSHLSLDVYGGQTVPGAQVLQWTPFNHTNQQWNIVPSGDGNSYHVVNVNSGKLLNVVGGATTPGAYVVQWPQEGGLNERWNIVASVAGAYNIVSVNSGLCLDVEGGSVSPGAKLLQWTCHGGTNQRWYIAPAGVLTQSHQKVMTSLEVTAIFWGPRWQDPNFVGDKMTGIEAFYQAFNGSTYAATTEEYKGDNGTVSNTVTWNGSLVDLSTASLGWPVAAEVCKMIPNPIANGYYPVYVDLPPNASFLGWHSGTTCHGVAVQFALLANLDADVNNPVSATDGRSAGLNRVANTSAHELNETRTDPIFNGTLSGWSGTGTNAGQECGDLCAWHMGLVTLTDGSQWFLQSNYSNIAYGAGLGTPRGCIFSGPVNYVK